MDNDGITRISEYGLGGLLRVEPFPGSIPTNVRWMAPEVLSGENKNKRATSVVDGKRADVYSLAMVMFEVGQRCLHSRAWVRVSHPSLPVPRPSLALPHFPRKVMRRL